MAVSVPEVNLTTELLLEEPWAPLGLVPPGTEAVRSPRGLEFLTYEACVAVLRDTNLGAGLPELFVASGVTDERPVQIADESVNNAEGARHVRLRAAIGSFFVPARVEALRGRVRQMISDLLDKAERPEGFDLADEVIKHIPSKLFALLLGVADSESDFIGRISEETIAVFSMDPELEEAVRRAYAEEDAWVEALLNRPEAGEGDNLVAHLLAQKDAGKLDAEEVHNAVVTLLAASVDTTQALAGLMMWSFIENPEQWQRLREDMSLVPGAVLEAARWRPGAAWTFRIALIDTELRGIPVSAGEPIFALVGSANRDPQAFSDPDRFDITRKGVPAPLNWSVGRHFCMGRMLAVMELEELLRVTATRWRGVRHADPAAAAAAPYGSPLKSLPVIVDAV
ncbi:cytochrome P450 [Streptomyces caniscabiei]|uniref:cytochrome P450 n=1 Tax=Streptomyces caniscabiei TaxID=2746961 RepID=UPI0029B84698|nr:cytochrome P450 [Streptomyces caniscabiei]MDX2600343.1 cytochrome P450 [Streptomyces caniscabiei]